MKSLPRSLLLALALTTGAWVPVQAQTFEQSFAAYERKDYGTAFAGFKKLAEQGHTLAQSRLDMMYAYGEGVPKDAQQAVAWYRKAAEKGDPDAQYNLGLMYDNGRSAACHPCNAPPRNPATPPVEVPLVPVIWPQNQWDQTRIIFD